jgi:UPF0716 protein FxsA
MRGTSMRDRARRGGTRRGIRRRSLWVAMAALFVVVPIVEVYFLIQVGQVIGAWWTLLLLVADGVLGSVLVKHEGSRAWRALREAIAGYQLPAKELADGALILVGGTLLLTPGFLSDVVGLFCILPFTRPVARAALTRLVARRMLVRTGVSAPGNRRRPGPDAVVQGEVVD